jgi:hypothetical protein
MSSRFQRGDDLGKIILEIIKDYPTITTTDIWYELWQNEKIPYGKKIEVGGISPTPNIDGLK